MLSTEESQAQKESPNHRATGAGSHPASAKRSQTETTDPCHACLHEFFEAQAERTPELSAVEFADEALTYRELNRRANALAHHLRSLGVGPDVRVGICLHPSFHLLIAVLAILKAGGAYVPLDPAYPVERLQFMLADSRAAILLTESGLRDVFPNLSTPAIFLNDDWLSSLQLDRGNPVRAATPDSLCYLIYTSGSTGTPKGVAMVHRALANLIDWQAKDPRLGIPCRTLQFTTLSFDVSCQELFSTWSSGGTLVLISSGIRWIPRELWTFIATKHVARVFLPFVALQQLADAADNEGTLAPALRDIVTAGEQLQITPKLRELFTRHPEAALHNHYGPSETHVVTAATLDGDPQTWPPLPPIGRPIQNTHIYLLDENREPIAAGQTGEVFVGGAALARGYFERPEVTAERFVPNPFAPEPEARLYRTGDLARVLPDGQIQFLGRVDHQVKIRGYRVELGETEAALNNVRGVRESAVVARDLSPGQKQLIGYVVRQSDCAETSSSLRTQLKKSLPEYMVPSAFVFLEALPLTPSGKVDRKALPSPSLENFEAANRLAPRTENERKIADTWQSVFQLNPIGIRDDFFDLGGHSLLAVRLISEINRVLNANLDVRALFAHPTIEALAKALEAEHQLFRRPRLVPLKGDGSGPPVFFIAAPMAAISLAKMSQRQQPFYTSEAPLHPDVLAASAQHNYAALPSIEEMAAPHTTLILESGFSGPCSLAGFSYGGILAFEVAHQLQRRGMTVEAVFLFDSNIKMRGWERFKWNVRNNFRFGPAYLWRKILQRMQRGVQDRTAMIAAQGELAASGAPMDLPSLDASWDVNHRIWQHALWKHRGGPYRPRQLSSRGFLFRARDSGYSEIHDYDGCLGWRNLFTGGVEIIEIPGTHASMWKEPQSLTLSRSWDACMESLPKPAHIPSPTL